MDGDLQKLVNGGRKGTLIVWAIDMGRQDRLQTVFNLVRAIGNRAKVFRAKQFAFWKSILQYPLFLFRHAGTQHFVFTDFLQQLVAEVTNVGEARQDGPFPLPSTHEHDVGNRFFLLMILGQVEILVLHGRRGKAVALMLDHMTFAHGLDANLRHSFSFCRSFVAQSQSKTDGFEPGVVDSIFGIGQSAKHFFTFDLIYFSQHIQYS